METTGEKPQARVVDVPEPGTFRTRLVKNGPWVPARIEFVDGKWTATINGDPQSPANEDPIKAKGVLDIWHSAQPIPLFEYDFMVSTKDWAEQHDHDHPSANPYKPINLDTLAPVFAGNQVEEEDASSSDPRLGIGGNSPPLDVPTVAAIKAHLDGDTKALRARAVALARDAKAFQAIVTEIGSDEQQGKASEVVAQIRSHARIIEKRRDAANRPWIDGGAAVRAHFNSIVGTLGSTADIEKKQTAYAKEQGRRRREAAEEQARKAQEEADRLAEQAAADLTSANLDAAEEAATFAVDAISFANANPADHSRVQSDLGVTSSLKATLVMTCTDITKVPPQYLIFNEAAARRAVLDAKKVKQSLTIPGVTIEWDSKIGNYARK